MPAPRVPTSRDEIKTPFEKCAPYQQLLKDIKDLKYRLKHENFGFSAPERHKEIKQEIKVLHRVQQRLSGFFNGTQPGCPLPATMRGPAAQQQFVGSKEIYCLPQLKLSADLVKAVRWSEETQFIKKQKSYTYNEVEEKRRIEKAIATTETALYKLGVPAGLYRQVDRVETVDPVYYTPDANTPLNVQPRKTPPRNKQ